MATLQQHKEAMVDLLANGSAIPASAARLAHALHDVLGLLLERDSGPRGSRVSEHMGTFIQDVRLAADLYHVTPEGPALLRAKLAAVKEQRDTYKARCESLEADIEGHTCDYEAVISERDKLSGYLSRGMAGVIAYQEDNRKAMD